MPISALLENQEKPITDKNISKIGIDYLNNLPKNDYILGPGDLLEVNVSNNYPELKTSTIIDSEGTIYLPSINRIYVNGLTIDELRKLLNQSLQKFVKFPNVEVKILGYRPINFYTAGEIKEPGLHVLEGSLGYTPVEFQNPGVIQNPGETQNPVLRSLSENSKVENLNYQFFPTIFDAIKKSDGFTRNADISNIELVRKNSISMGGGEIKKILNFQKFLQGDMSQNIRIYDGDSIIVKKSTSKKSNSLDVAYKTNINPKYIEVFVQGNVASPGLQRLPSQSSLNQAILFAGGINVLNGPITHITFLPDGTYKSKKYKYKKNAKPGTASNPFLNSKDIIFINKGKLLKTSQILDIVSSPITNIISSYALINALSD